MFKMEILVISCFFSSGTWSWQSKTDVGCKHQQKENAGTGRQPAVQVNKYQSMIIVVYFKDLNRRYLIFY